MKTDRDYEKLIELLKLETYPHRYTHKFIGAKTEAFVAALAALEAKFAAAKKISARESPGSGGTIYLALTYELLATCPEDVVALLKATASLPDLRIIL